MEMALLDFIRNRNASQQQPVAQTPQQQTPPQPTVESLPAHVKAQAVEAARPAAELMERATTPQTSTPPPPASNERSRGRALGMER